MVDAPARWRVRGWSTHPSRPEPQFGPQFGPGPDATARAAEVFGPYARSAAAELRAPVETCAPAGTRPLGISSRPDGAVAGPDDGPPGRDGEPPKKYSPLLAPRNSIPIRREAKSGVSDGSNTQPKESKTDETVAAEISSNLEMHDLAALAARLRAAVAVKS